MEYNKESRTYQDGIRTSEVTGWNIHSIHVLRDAELEIVAMLGVYVIGNISNSRLALVKTLEYRNPPFCLLRTIF
jgi:hypothetical protein